MTIDTRTPKFVFPDITNAIAAPTHAKKYSQAPIESIQPQATRVAAQPMRSAANTSMLSVDRTPSRFVFPDLTDAIAAPTHAQKYSNSYSSSSPQSLDSHRSRSPSPTLSSVSNNSQSSSNKCEGFIKPLEESCKQQWARPSGPYTKACEEISKDYNHPLKNGLPITGSFISAITVGTISILGVVGVIAFPPILIPIFGLLVACLAMGGFQYTKKVLWPDRKNKELIHLPAKNNYYLNKVKGIMPDQLKDFDKLKSPNEDRSFYILKPTANSSGSPQNQSSSPKALKKLEFLKVREGDVVNGKDYTALKKEREELLNWCSWIVLNATPGLNKSNLKIELTGESFLFFGKASKSHISNKNVESRKKMINELESGNRGNIPSKVDAQNFWLAPIVSHAANNKLHELGLINYYFNYGEDISNLQKSKRTPDFIKQQKAELAQRRDDRFNEGESPLYGPDLLYAPGQLMLKEDLLTRSHLYKTAKDILAAHSYLKQETYLKQENQDSGFIQMKKSADNSVSDEAVSFDSFSPYLRDIFNKQISSVVDVQKRRINFLLSNNSPKERINLTSIINKMSERLIKVDLRPEFRKLHFELSDMLAQFQSDNIRGYANARNYFGSTNHDEVNKILIKVIESDREIYQWIQENKSFTKIKGLSKSNADKLRSDLSPNGALHKALKTRVENLAKLNNLIA